MNELTYDAPKISKMEDFIKYLYELVVQNNGISIDRRIVYRLLDRIGLKKDDINTDGLPKDIKNQFFQEWTNAFKGKKTTKAFCDEENWNYWEQFVTAKRPSEPYIKIYVPLDYEHLKEGVISLFEFIDDLGVEHASKVGKNLRNDNVVIRLNAYDLDAFSKIMGFIKSNRYLQEGMNQTNPFLPSISGVGYMIDAGGSYNGFIAECLAKYISQLVERGEKPDIKDFYYFASKQTGTNKEDLANKEALDIAFGMKKTKDEKYDWYNNQKGMLLLDALQATFEKYGYEQASFALVAIIKKGKYNFITNGNDQTKYRDSLKANVTPKDALNIVKKYLTIKGISVEGLDENTLAETFSKGFFSNQEVMRFEKSCMVTLENRGESWLESALTYYLRTGNASGFSRHSQFSEDQINYREEISKIDYRKAKALICEYLSYLGINANELQFDEALHRFLAVMQKKYEAHISQKK